MVDCIPWQKYKNVFIHPNIFVENAYFLFKETFFQLIIGTCLAWLALAYDILRSQASKSHL